MLGSPSFELVLHLGRMHDGLRKAVVREGDPVFLKKVSELLKSGLHAKFMRAMVRQDEVLSESG